MPLLLTVVSISFAISLASTFLAEKLSGVVPILGSFFVLRLSYNSGIAFSIALPGSSQNILIVAALIVVIVLALRTAHDTLGTIAFGLILGGAFANLVDRIPDGLVTDFISVGTFPIFNIADSCITVGAVLLLLQGVRWKRGERRDGT